MEGGMELGGEGRMRLGIEDVCKKEGKKAAEDNTGMGKL